ncbi:hypothetical protein B0H13DRAFT_2038068 [Mycena leptocephala]|nr:hypothetical protein B0H13DRAFT_2038068 [Mycena leptocephala]
MSYMLHAQRLLPPSVLPLLTFLLLLLHPTHPVRSSLLYTSSPSASYCLTPSSDHILLSAFSSFTASVHFPSPPFPPAPPPSTFYPSLIPDCTTPRPRSFPTPPPSFLRIYIPSPALHSISFHLSPLFTSILTNISYSI